MRIVIAPDKFKGTLTSIEAARAMSDGARRARPDADIIECPLADGGEGTGEVLATNLGGLRRPLVVEGPLGDAVQAEIVELGDGSTLIEAASASGLALVLPQRRDALRASSLGTGRLLQAALSPPSSPAKVVVAVGGTASSDGGTGAATAMGWRFLDRKGVPIGDGGGTLRHLARIVPPPGAPVEVEVLGACDVDVPLTGERGAARVFSPQKGAGPSHVQMLEEGLEVLADRIHEDLGIDVSGERHAGAGGGLGAGLIAFFGARLESGFAVVARAVGLSTLLEGADVVLSGEGRLDEQSLGGKCVVGVARMARDLGVRCGVVAGEQLLDEAALRVAGIEASLGLVPLVGRDQALGDPAGAVARATQRIVASMGV